MIRFMRLRTTCFLYLILTCTLSISHATGASPANDCGELVTIHTHDKTTTRYSLASPASVALVLLAGGGGHLDLDDTGCA
jgi:hypothetical protein